MFGPGKRTPHYDLAHVQADGRRALGGGSFHQDRLRRRPNHGTNDGGDAGGNRLAVASRILQVDDDLRRSSRVAGRVSRSNTDAKGCLQSELRRRVKRMLRN